jgi:hypothetical protein
MRSAEEPEAGGKGLTAASSPLRERLLRLRRSITEPLLQYFHDMHMVRGPKCLSPRRNWDFPTHSLASECAPLSPEPKGGGQAREGLGESQFRRLEKKLSTVGQQERLSSLLKVTENCQNMISAYWSLGEGGRVIVYICQCCGSGMFIPDPGS